MNARGIIFCILFLVGCENKSEVIPPGIISKDSMISIMADIHIAESRLVVAGVIFKQKDIKSAYMRKVLSEASVDTTRFLKSFDFYAARPVVFSEMYEQVIVEISKRQAEEK